MARRLVLLALLVSCGGSGPGVPAVTEVGSPHGEPVTAEIGPDGGEIVAPDGSLRLVVPVGAIDATETITLQAVESFAPGGLGDAWRLQPDGLTFSVPAVLSFETDGVDLSGAGALGVAFQTAERTWEWMPGPVPAGSVVRVETSHFTDFSLVAGAVLRPGSANVAVGESLTLDLAICYPPSVGDEDLEPLGYACEGEDAELASPSFVGEWSVNGQAGGSATVGTIAGDGASAVYTAPATVPSPATVAVSAEVSGTGSGRTLVVSNVTVTGGAGGYAGTVSFQNDALGIANGEAQVTWTFRQGYSDHDVYVGSGTISADVTIPDCETVHVSSPISTAAADESWTLGSHLEVNGPTHAFPGTHVFSVIGESVTQTVTCGVSSGSPYTLDDYELGGFLFAIGAPCAGTTDLPVNQDGQLSGTFDCPEMAVTASWTFTATP